jgi:Family of unknown function (DUF6204)
MSTHVYRVTVRGQFASLSGDQRRILAEHAASHDVTAAAYTPRGTFIYDGTHRAFSLRYEIRVEQDDRTSADGQAITRAMELATSYLEEVQLPHKRLRASAVNMGDVWSDPTSQVADRIGTDCPGP